MLKKAKNLLVLRGCLAALAACCAAFCLFRSFEGNFWNSAAMAQEATPAIPGQTENQRLELKYSLDTLAASLGAGLGRLDEEELGKAMAARLNELFGQLRATGYITLWRGTKALCSPLTPDVEGRDFGPSRDENGAPYVADMEAAARGGGGFTEFSLKNSRWDAEPEHYICYAAPVYGAPFHLSVWAASPAGQPPKIPTNKTRRGYFISGLSFAGLAFVLLPSARRFRTC